MIYGASHVDHFLDTTIEITCIHDTSYIHGIGDDICASFEHNLHTAYIYDSQITGSEIWVHSQELRRVQGTNPIQTP